MLNFLKNQSKTSLFVVSASLFLSISLLVGTPFLPALLISLPVAALFSLALKREGNNSSKASSHSAMRQTAYSQTLPSKASPTLNLGSTVSQAPISVASATVSHKLSTQSEDLVKILKAKKQKGLSDIKQAHERELEQYKGTQEEQSRVRAYEFRIKQYALTLDKEILEAKKQRHLMSGKEQHDKSMQKPKRTEQERQALEAEYQAGLKRVISDYDEQIASVKQQYLNQFGSDMDSSETHSPISNINAQPLPAQGLASIEAMDYLQKLEANKQKFLLELEKFKQEEAQLKSAPNANLKYIAAKKQSLEAQVSYFESRVLHAKRQQQACDGAKQKLPNYCAMPQLDIALAFEQEMKSLKDKHEKELEKFKGASQERMALIQSHEQAIKNFEEKHAIVSEGLDKQRDAYVKAKKALK